MASPKRIRHPDMPMVSLKTGKDPATLPTLENYMLERITVSASAH